MTLLDDDELQEPDRPAAPRAQKTAAAPKTRREEMQRAFFQFAVGCILTLIMGGVFLKFSILTTSSAVIAVAVQITAFVIYFTTSDIMTGYHVTEKQVRRDVVGPERRARRRRTGLRFITGLMLVFLAVMSFQRFGVLRYPPPWKITNPSSKLFNPDKFRFTDYRTAKEIDVAARTLFPAGTPKAAVDRVLHDAGHASIKIYDTGASSKTFCYTYSSSASRGFLTGVVAWVLSNPEADKLWFVFVRYNPQNKVTGVSGTVQLDQSGALPYTQMTPLQTTAPYAPPAPGPFK
jgi:hypothetical protein